MLLVALGWIYVVLMVAVVQATGNNGSALGAVFTFAFYGLLPVGILVYLMLSPARRRAGRAAEQAQRRQADEALQLEASLPPASPSGPGLDPDGRRHPPGGPVAAEGKEP